MSQRRLVCDSEKRKVNERSGASPPHRQRFATLRIVDKITTTAQYNDLILITQYESVFIYFTIPPATFERVDLGRTYVGRKHNHFGVHCAGRGRFRHVRRR